MKVQTRMSPSVRPYFTYKAEGAMRAAGGDPANAGPLARWAQEAREIGEVHRGVIVAEDGTLVAETVQNRAHPELTIHVVTEADRVRLGLDYTEVRRAIAQLRRDTGQCLIHVTMSSVCLGAGPRR